MTFLQIVAIIMTLAALFAYVNERLFRLPNTIGVMLIGMALSLIMLVLGGFFPELREMSRDFLQSIDFNETLMQGMLSFLLFAGALHVNINDLFDQKWAVSILATLGVITSTVLVGLGFYGLVGLVGIDIPLIYCFVFGALISPTDPIAVLGILKRVGAPKSLETLITGESLFNDGVGVVIFLVIVGIASGAAGHGADLGGAMTLLGQEAIGGAVFGLALGYVGYVMLKTIDNYHVEVLISLAMVAGGYALASALHLSGPIAIVVAGLFAGNQGRRLAMSDITRRRLDDFWELVDEILNVVLFLLIGVEIMVLTFHGEYLIAGILAIPMVLLVRFVAVGVPISAIRMFKKFPPRSISILTWGGLRGGISVALALSLPQVPEREPIVAITYVIVVFSIVVQGLTIGCLVAASQPSPSAEPPQ